MYSKLPILLTPHVFKSYKIATSASVLVISRSWLVNSKLLKRHSKGKPGQKLIQNVFTSMV